MKALCTIGEVDKDHGYPVTGWPDGNAAWLVDENTVRVVFQSESYGMMSTPTRPSTMKSGASVTGSQVHTIDVDRSMLVDFLTGDNKGSDIIQASGLLYDTIYNIWGNEVQPHTAFNNSKDSWGAEIKDKDGIVQHTTDPTAGTADLHQHSFCGSWYQPPNFYGANMGFADDIYMMAEEWTWTPDTQHAATSTIGLNTVTVDIANKAAYVTPALGQTGYEKLIPVNPQSTEHVVIVAAGYNYGYEPAPLKVYVGIKGKNADGTAGAGFLARNGLAFGKLYGLAITDATVTTLGLDPANKYSKTEFMEKYLADESAPDKFDAKFFPTSYQYDGNVVNVDETEVLKWISDSEQPTGHVFFNGDTKTEHPAADPGSKSRWVQSMTDDGAYLAIELTDLAAELPAGGLPTSLTAKCVRLIGAWDGSMTLTTTAVGSNGASASKHIEKDVAKPVAPDGLAWIQGSDGITIIADEDSGNDWGDRKYAIMLGEDADGDLTVTGSYLLAIGGGPETRRGQAQVSALTGAWSRDRTTEFSGTWDLSALVAKATGSELAATNAGIALNDKLLLGTIQHGGESGGQAADMMADNGGQVMILQLKLPSAPVTLITLGETTGLIAVASDTITPTSDNADGNVNWEYLEDMKALCTIGEVDKDHGYPVTGWPDGNAAWLVDENTVRVVYQSESYGMMSTPTRPSIMKSGASVTGSQVHTIDVDRSMLVDFLTGDNKGSDIIQASGLLYDTIYNIWGNEVQPHTAFKDGKDSWGAEIKDKDGIVQHTTDPTAGTADMHRHSFCGSWYQPPNFYGA